MFLKPSKIRFSQDSIGNSFGGYTAHPYRRIGQTLDDIISDRCDVGSIPCISVMKKDGLWFTADNRRLWVFQQAEKRGKIEEIFVSKTFYINCNKFTTVNNGISVRVRGDPGGYLWRRVPLIQSQEKKPFTDVSPAVNQRHPLEKPTPFHDISHTENTRRSVSFGIRRTTSETKDNLATSPNLTLIPERWKLQNNEIRNVLRNTAYKQNDATIAPTSRIYSNSTLQRSENDMPMKSNTKKDEMFDISLKPNVYQETHELSNTRSNSRNPEDIDESTIGAVHISVIKDKIQKKRTEGEKLTACKEGFKLFGERDTPVDQNIKCMSSHKSETNQGDISLLMEETSFPNEGKCKIFNKKICGGLVICLIIVFITAVVLIATLV